MADGALSWLAMVAGAYFADGVVPRRGELPLAGSLICYRPYECADGWVSLGALEPKFWQAWCRGVGREDLIAKQFERPGSDAHEQVQEIFRDAHARRVGDVRARDTTAAWSRCSSSTRRSTPSSCARARWSSRSTSPAPSARCASSASPSSSTARPAITPGCPARRSASTPKRCCSRPATPPQEVAELLAGGAAAGPASTTQDVTLRA